MPMASVLLRPGVNVEMTQALNEAGFYTSQLLRFKDGMAQTLGGWEQYGGVVPSTVRDLHPWQGIATDTFLGIGATANLQVVTDGSNSNITPQTNTTNPPPNFSISSGSNVVTVIDAGSSATVYNTVFFNTPVSLGGQLLNGAYRIQSVSASSVYTIHAATVSSTTIASSGILPIFTTVADSANVSVLLPAHDFSAIPGLYETFYAPTSVGGLTIEGPYEVTSVLDTTSFTITADTLATSASTVTMNSSLAQLVYYITLGPQALGSGFGDLGFGDGGFGSGSASAGVPGTTITAEDWTLDNWGGVLLACPKDGAIYTWYANSGFQNAQVIQQAPFFNGGIFVSMPQQILVAWRSCQSTGSQSNLVVRWSDAGDYEYWEVGTDSAAGSFTLPTGSIIVGGLQAQTYGVISTDVDVWQMSYIGGDVTFNFTRVGAGCGWAGPHAAGVISGDVFWCGRSNFFKFGSNGVETLPCAVWDFIFQNINADHLDRVFCAPNSAFNEISWFFPSSGATENDSYVKYNISERTWDYGSMTRTAWTDLSVLGNPIGVDTGGFLWQHEMGQEVSGASVTSFQTGWWSINEGNDLAFVDFVMPDFKWGLYGDDDAQLQITFYSVNYAGDTPVSYGPFSVNQATQYLAPRIRGRMMSVLIQSANNVFWRLGRIRYRWAPAGRR